MCKKLCKFLLDKSHPQKLKYEISAKEDFIEFGNGICAEYRDGTIQSTGWDAINVSRLRPTSPDRCGRHHLFGTPDVCCNA
jgi:hypothetical protein